ncbi:MAG: hypothetical protein KKH88_04275 [Nanoarchaeota archaeon]|nr:hypothetical protein [Nanoarchaeota archaeon]MBU1444669.1 hypothetical protein [Nanoarchaeota archaeon]MBU2406776.1 hypothetical protein [Nanoarchaeota archaeon]MBU2420313.1 hypothetical protein [Nanoarchaeota archaeon]MBU2475017.1 hypothetical protein [Nanoarchaeota archaeon]
MARKNDQGKTIAILSYITIIGWIIALIMNTTEKSKLGSYHIRQTLLLYIFAVILSWIPIVGWILGIVLFIFWILGLVGAINGEQKEMPIVGGLAQQWFKGL